jgi:uncharacterized protein YjbJ (UPF0337 family)
MNEDRVIGAGQDMVGKVEWKVGDAINDQEMQADGVVDRLAGVFQHGYGTARDLADDAAEVTPVLLERAADRGRDLGRRVDAVVRENLGDNGALYLLAGAIGLVGLGLFAVSQARRGPSGATRSQTSRPAARRAPVKRAARTKSAAA